ncbi:MAG TPA: polysaccharide biosynthesis C-terminal domain-containing protein [Bacteroidales bacterium]
MNPLKQFAGQTAIYGVPTIVGRFLNYLLVPMYTRVFLTAEYGVVSELYAYVSFLFVLLTYGMETAFFRFAQEKQHRASVYSTALLSLLSTSAIFVFMAVIFSGSIADWLDYSNHREYIIWFALILAFDAISSIPYANLRKENKALKFALIKTINIFINIGLNLFFILLCPYLLLHSHSVLILNSVQFLYNPAVGVGYIFISNLVASAATLLVLSGDLLKVRLAINGLLLKQMLKYAWPLLLFSFAGIINETFDRIILKHLLPESSNPMAQLGIYGACYKISILMTLFIQTYRYAAEPFFFQKAKSTDAKVLYANMMTYFVIICTFIFVCVMLYIDLVMHFVGEKYRVGAPVVPILLFANLCLGVFYNLSIWFKLTDKTIYGAFISIFGAVVTLVLNFVLIPVIGIMGAAWATLICYASMMVISYIIGQRFYPVKYDIPRIIGYLILAIFIYKTSQWVHLHGLLKYGFSTLLLLIFTAVIALTMIKSNIRKA